MNLDYTINLNLPATSDPAVFNAIFKAPDELRDYPTPPGSMPCSSSFLRRVFRLMPRICAART